MTLPSVPTDNLYKFLAVSGVVLIISANYLTSQTMMTMQELRSKEQQSSEDRVLKMIWDRVDGVRKDHEEKAERTSELQNIDPTLKEIQRIELEKLVDRIDEIETEAETMVHMLAWMELIGFLLTPLGFCLWWFKVQRHQDAMILFEAIKLRHECEMQKNQSKAGGAVVSERGSVSPSPAPSIGSKKQ